MQRLSRLRKSPKASLAYRFAECAEARYACGFSQSMPVRVPLMSVHFDPSNSTAKPWWADAGAPPNGRAKTAARTLTLFASHRDIPSDNRFYGGLTHADRFEPSDTSALPGCQVQPWLCRSKMRMSGLCKVEMSGFIQGGRRDGTGANRVEREGTGGVEGFARSGARSSTRTGRWSAPNTWRELSACARRARWRPITRSVGKASAGGCSAKMSAPDYAGRAWRSNGVWTVRTGCASAAVTCRCMPAPAAPPSATPCGLRPGGVADAKIKAPPPIKTNCIRSRSSLEETLEADISIRQKTGHFYVALTVQP